ncbi:4-hydroxybenzoate octaprenyltransferase [Parvularcula sp. LCG005]|uniref:4-hydroxybenzoate octaprenyltransferase n=1 Tax=Parvularcula sp. LCG005 TaxID=3078805 RepID=UPI0029427B45|nr:4-hydroxybenzoate octaprenyltransferase [Parvularcula sp. LCG005]WOI53806.1 4-hydroxybenzoate octaprenyltransferase [Parvularcula sp. LCG005]
MTDQKTPDAAPEGWVDRMPSKVRPYLRLMRADRPVGMWLLFWPCIWGSLIARPDGTSPQTLYGYWLLFLIGAYVMRSAGCVYNDIVDRDIDAKVARTASRPVAAGIVSVRSAWLLLVGLSLIGLVVLLQLGLVAILTGMASLALVAGYPFMKRITWWPQAWLGLTFNWGALVGAATLAGTIPMSAVLYYAAGLFWTLGYDTIYAHQDREDDALVGVKSSARRLGDASKKGIAIFYGIALMLAATGLLVAGAGWGTLWLLPASAHMAWQVATLDINDGHRCLMLFKSNVWTGLLFALPCLAA